MDAGARPLEFVNVPSDAQVYSKPQLTWMDETYFLLTLRSMDICTLRIASLQGVAAEIVTTASDTCPDADFSFAKP